MLEVYLMVCGPPLPPPHTAPTPERFAYRKSDVVNNLITWNLLFLSPSLSLSLYIRSFHPLTKFPANKPPFPSPSPPSKVYKPYAHGLIPYVGKAGEVKTDQTFLKSVLGTVVGLQFGLESLLNFLSFRFVSSRFVSFLQFSSRIE